MWLPRDRGHLDEGHGPGPWNALEIVGLDPRTGEDRWCHRLDPALCGEPAASMEADADLVLHTVDVPGERGHGVRRHRPG